MTEDQAMRDSADKYVLRYDYQPAQSCARRDYVEGWKSKAERDREEMEAMRALLKEASGLLQDAEPPEKMPGAWHMSRERWFAFAEPYGKLKGAK